MCNLQGFKIGAFTATIPAMVSLIPHRLIVRAEGCAPRVMTYKSQERSAYAQDNWENPIARGFTDDSRDSCSYDENSGT